MCVSAVTQVGTVSVSVQPLLPMLKSVTAEGSTSAGGPRSSVVCQRHTMHTPTLARSIFCACTFTPVLLSFCNLCFLPSPQLCSVKMGWCMIPVVQLALPHVPVISRVHTPSVALSPVWRAAFALLAKSNMVGQIYQTNP